MPSALLPRSIQPPTMLALRQAGGLAQLLSVGAPLACSRLLGQMQGIMQDRSVTSSVYTVGQATNIRFHDGMVPRQAKEALLGQRGVVVWFTGGGWKAVEAANLTPAAETSRG